MSKIKDWKQITTSYERTRSFVRVVQDVKDQRLKANHNVLLFSTILSLSGSRCQRSKIESKSQQAYWLPDEDGKWFKMSKIKDWKQITTQARWIHQQGRVVQDVKDQRLKANHNVKEEYRKMGISGSRCQRSKIESKSQRNRIRLSRVKSGSRCQRSKIESKSQQLSLHIWLADSGSRCQRSKIESKSQPYPLTHPSSLKWFKMSKIKDWKQITTTSPKTLSDKAVVQDVKDQRLKANHNRIKTRQLATWSGSRCQRSKIESKSQPNRNAHATAIKWFKMSKIKDWKQITTEYANDTSKFLVVQDVKDQRLKANHNRCK